MDGVERIMVLGIFAVIVSILGVAAWSVTQDGAALAGNTSTPDGLQVNALDTGHVANGGSRGGGSKVEATRADDLAVGPRAKPGSHPAWETDGGSQAGRDSSSKPASSQQHPVRRAPGPNGQPLTLRRPPLVGGPGAAGKQPQQAPPTTADAHRNALIGAPTHGAPTHGAPTHGGQKGSDKPSTSTQMALKGQTPKAAGPGSAKPAAQPTAPVGGPRNAAPPKTMVVAVKDGDSVWKIMKRLYPDAGPRLPEISEEIQRLNPKTDIGDVYPGDELVVPHPGFVTASIAAMAPAAKPLSRMDAHSSEWSFYTVREGENLTAIARDQLGEGYTWNDIYELNRLTIPNPDAVSPGMVIKLPNKP